MTFAAVFKSKPSTFFALVLMASMLTACGGGTDPEVNDWWYDQQWDGSPVSE